MATLPQFTAGPGALKQWFSVRSSGPGINATPQPANSPHTEASFTLVEITPTDHVTPGSDPDDGIIWVSVEQPGAQCTKATNAAGRHCNYRMPPHVTVAMHIRHGTPLDSVMTPEMRLRVQVVVTDTGVTTDSRHVALSSIAPLHIWTRGTDNTLPWFDIQPSPPPPPQIDESNLEDIDRSVWFVRNDPCFFNGPVLNLSASKGRPVFRVLLSFVRSQTESHSSTLCSDGLGLFSQLFSLVSDEMARRRLREDDDGDAGDDADDAAIVALEEEEGRLLAMTAQLGVQLRKVQRRLSVARAPGGGADEVNNNAMQDSLVALEQRLLDALKLDTVDANALARLNADINTALDAADGIQTHLRILFVGSSRCPRSFVPVEREKLECITGTDIVNGMDVALEGKDVENAKPATIVDVISYISGGCGGQLYDVIHFAGHGDSGGIVIDDGDLEGDVTSAPTVTPDVIGAAIKRYRESLPPKRPAPLIVLNTCNTRSTSLAIARASQTEVVHPAAASVFGWYAAKFARKLYKALARTWEGDDACTLDVRRALYSTNDRMLMDYDGDRFCCTYELTTSTSRISLRQDQRDLIAKCFDAKTGRYTNSIIVAPTGFGKTQLPPNVWARIVGREHTDENGVQYVQPPTRAESSSGPGAMVFVAHTHDLVLQQADELRVGFRSLGWSVRVVSFVGERALSATAAVADKLVHFGEVLKDRNALVVVCVVASILQDALDAGKADLTDVSLLVFDECHLCDGDHPYNTVMKRHWRPRNLDIIARAGGEGSLTFNPHILGVTATPFAGAQGEEGISRLMGNLCTPNMASHAGPTVAFEECACDAKGMRDAPMSKTLITLVKQCTQMLSMELRKLSNDVTPRTDVGEAQRLCDDIVSELDAAGSHVWLSKLEMASSRLKHAGIVLSSQPMLPVARLLRRAAKAVHLLYAVGPREAYDHIITFTEREMTKTDDATKRLYASIQKDELKNITRAAQHARSRQPSSLMAVLVERLRTCAEESTTLVMCDMRCVVRYVHRVLAADHVLQRRSPLMMVGRTTPGAGDGTKGDTPRQSGSTRKDAFGKFRRGQCRILVATKVANLGMNAPSCAFVVSFGLALTANEYVHAKGRARKKDGRLLALDYENSSRLAVIRALEGAERQNIEAIAKVSAGDATQIAKRVLACQQSLHDTWLRQRADAERKKSEFAALASENDSSRYDAYCSCFARLYSGDAIVIVDKVHRCLKSEDWQTEFADTLCIGELDNVKTIDADTSIIKHGVLCRACRRPTGSILRHTRMHVDYAMVNVEAVHFRERGTEKEPIAKKKWALVPINFAQVS